MNIKINKDIIEQVSGIILITTIICFLLWLIFQAHFSAGYETGIQSMVITLKTSQKPILEQIELPENSHQMQITGFSSHECKTTWCRANAGKPRNLQVALNPKYGKYSKVYIPVYNKTYDVIGTTDTYTDLDIWFGDDYQSALEFGSKNLLVYLIK